MNNQLNNQSKKIELFVPGRICLFGEHSDWAGGYRRINSEIEKGYTIICGTNQGLYATAKPHESKVIYHTRDWEGNKKTFSCDMKESELLELAGKGGFWSYIAGVAHQVLVHYHVRGVEIDNYKTDLPVKKGLSSSAATCVLVARAFNRIYDLKMTTRGEMEFAYRGEITTPSRCGRMDQGCAYGNRPILMTYDGDALDVEELAIPNNLYFVIVDLDAKKDTVKILRDLNKAYPFPDNGIEKQVHTYLGPINKVINEKAKAAIQSGDAETIGRLMTEAQELFDKHLMPACPDQLEAPVLHRTIHHESLKPFVLGGKGVGSQGDGTAQFIVKDEAAQKEVIDTLKTELGMNALALTLFKTKKVRKAVITAAGSGTRMFPISKVLRKEFMPVTDSSGIMKPLLLKNIEEALAAGIEEVGLIIREEERERFEMFFKEPSPPEVFQKLSRANQQYARYLEEIGKKITFISQESPRGLGDAVLRAKEWVGPSPFLLLLGDHYFSSSADLSCAGQLVQGFDKINTNIVGVIKTDVNDVHRFGTLTGKWETANKILEVTEIKEKPTPEYARDHLYMEGFDEETFLTVFGQYILSPSVFTELETMIEEDMFEKGELELTTALERLRNTEGLYGHVIEGEKIDIGIPEAYRKTFSK